MPPAQAADLLTACCGSQRWVSRLVARRPFRSRQAILEAADQEWGSLTPVDWREAFAHHPRIGERKSDLPQSQRGQQWSAGEQRKVDGTGALGRDALFLVNQDYEARFGHLYVVDATGKSAAEMVAIARARLANDPESELRIAAGEQRKIMRRRMERLFR